MPLLLGRENGSLPCARSSTIAFHTLPLPLPSGLHKGLRVVLLLMLGMLSQARRRTGVQSPHGRWYALVVRCKRRDALPVTAAAQESQGHSTTACHRIPRTTTTTIPFVRQ